MLRLLFSFLLLFGVLSGRAEAAWAQFQDNGSGGGFIQGFIQGVYGATDATGWASYSGTPPTTYYVASGTGGVCGTGSDSYNGTSPTHTSGNNGPFLTWGAGINALNALSWNGSIYNPVEVWMLVCQGDTLSGHETYPYIPGGLSAVRPLIFSSYHPSYPNQFNPASGAAEPIVQCGDSTYGSFACLPFWVSANNSIVITGLTFYAQFRDPGNSSFNAGDQSSTMSSLTQQNNILIEDTALLYGWGGFGIGVYPSTNFTFRRNTIAFVWGGEATAFETGGITPITVEENVFHEGGWSKILGTPVPVGTSGITLANPTVINWNGSFPLPPISSPSGSQVAILPSAGGTLPSAIASNGFSANSSWTTSNSVITMLVSNPGFVQGGTACPFGGPMQVYDATNSRFVGTVGNYTGTTLTLTTNALAASLTSTDLLIFSCLAGQPYFNQLYYVCNYTAGSPPTFNISTSSSCSPLVNTLGESYTGDPTVTFIYYPNFTSQTFAHNLYPSGYDTQGIIGSVSPWTYKGNLSSWGAGPNSFRSGGIVVDNIWIHDASAEGMAMPLATIDQFSNNIILEGANLEAKPIPSEFGWTWGDTVTEYNWDPYNNSGASLQVFGNIAAGNLSQGYSGFTVNSGSNNVSIENNISFGWGGTPFPTSASISGAVLTMSVKTAGSCTGGTCGQIANFYAPTAAQIRNGNYNPGTGYPSCNGTPGTYTVGLSGSATGSGATVTVTVGSDGCVDPVTATFPAPYGYNFTSGGDWGTGYIALGNAGTEYSSNDVLTCGSVTGHTCSVIPTGWSLKVGPYPAIDGTGYDINDIALSGGSGDQTAQAFVWFVTSGSVTSVSAVTVGFFGGGTFGGLGYVASPPDVLTPASTGMNGITGATFNVTSVTANTESSNCGDVSGTNGNGGGCSNGTVTEPFTDPLRTAGSYCASISCASPNATFTGHIVNGVLSIDSGFSGNPVLIGDAVIWSGQSHSDWVKYQISGTPGGVGTYELAGASLSSPESQSSTSMSTFNSRQIIGSCSNGTCTNMLGNNKSVWANSQATWLKYRPCAVETYIAAGFGITYNCLN